MRLLSKKEDELKSFKGHITFKDVHFSYDGRVKVSEDLNLELKEGETVAVAGPTGAGKTLINLLSRYYEFQDGKIMLDDVDIRTYL